MLTLRILLGLIYVVFGFNFFFHYIPMPIILGDGGTLIGVMVGTGWFTVIKVLEIIGGISLLSNQYSRLGAVILMPITVNILIFHTVVSFGPGMGVVMLIIDAAILYGYKQDFKGILKKS